MHELFLNWTQNHYANANSFVTCNLFFWRMSFKFKEPQTPERWQSPISCHNLHLHSVHNNVVYELGIARRIMFSENAEFFQSLYDIKHQQVDNTSNCKNAWALSRLKARVKPHQWSPQSHGHLKSGRSACRRNPARKAGNQTWSPRLCLCSCCCQCPQWSHRTHRELAHWWWWHPLRHPRSSSSSNMPPQQEVPPKTTPEPILPPLNLK